MKPSTVLGKHSSARGAGRSRIGRVGFRMLAAVAMIGGLLALAGLADNSPAVAADGECLGVAVVVDFTDIGGEIEVACAEGEIANGRDALIAAGFATTDSPPGFLCAINSMPDPCPETFDGNFWAYWHSSPNGEWTNYQVGADSSTPIAGNIEGWRYNDGVAAPGIAPADAFTSAGISGDAEPESEANPGSGDSSATNPDGHEMTNSTPSSEKNLADQRSSQTLVLGIVAVGFLALIAAFVVFFALRKRRDRRE